MKVTVSYTLDYTYECEIDDNAPDILSAVDAADPICFQTSQPIQAEGRITSIIDENGRYLYDDGL